MRFRRRLVGLLFAAAVASVAAVVPASAAHADVYYIDYRELASVNSYKCLTANGSDRNSPVVQLSCSGAYTQAWAMMYVQTINGFPYYQFVNRWTQLCLEVRNGSAASGAAVDQFLCSSAADEMWGLFYISPWTFYLVNYQSGKCLDVSGASRDDSALIQQWDCNHTVAQKWWVLPT